MDDQNVFDILLLITSSSVPWLFSYKFLLRVAFSSHLRSLQMGRLVQSAMIVCTSSSNLWKRFLQQDCSAAMGQFLSKVVKC